MMLSEDLLYFTPQPSASPPISQMTIIPGSQCCYKDSIKLSEMLDTEYVLLQMGAVNSSWC